MPQMQGPQDSGMNHVHASYFESFCAQPGVHAMAGKRNVLTECPPPVFRPRPL